MATGIARRVVPGQSPPAGRRNVRGLTRGIEVSRTMAMNNGNKLPVEKFVVDTTVPFIRKYLNDNMVKHFKGFGTIEEALLNPPRNVSQDSWNYLCDWFSSETVQKKAQEVQLVYIQTFHDTHTRMVKNSDDENEVQWISKEAQIRHEKMLELYQQVQQGIAEGSQPHEELDIFNEVIGAKRYKRQRGSSASSSNGVVNEFRDLIETLNEKIKSQEDQILKYQDEIKEMKDENQKMKDDNAAFKEYMFSRLGFMFSRLGFAPAMLNNLPIPPQEHN
ncbi:hypothetical protein C5167_004310 [Papaver somniferum]|uniref:Uncharacterized protein n=2 Tax=Papaver somniferum TaxID=3469 RepID=A0A4Y7J869_PAPSO|nr:hypothetical protein C5167_004310 [Papaver somniferum]